MSLTINPSPLIMNIIETTAKLTKVPILICEIIRCLHVI